MSKETNNTFNKGMVKDVPDMQVPAEHYTDALNATLISGNGNEYIMQNDYGNAKIYEDSTASGNNIKNVELSPGFIPVGSIENRGIWYIASYNPQTGEGELGTYPSPNYTGTNVDLTFDWTWFVDKLDSDNIQKLCESLEVYTPNSTTTISALEASLEEKFKEVLQDKISSYSGDSNYYYYDDGSSDYEDSTANLLRVKDNDWTADVDQRTDLIYEVAAEDYIKFTGFENEGNVVFNKSDGNSYNCELIIDIYDSENKISEQTLKPFLTNTQKIEQAGYLRTTIKFKTFGLKNLVFSTLNNLVRINKVDGSYKIYPYIKFKVSGYNTIQDITEFKANFQGDESFFNPDYLSKLSGIDTTVTLNKNTTSVINFANTINYYDVSDKSAENNYGVTSLGNFLQYIISQESFASDSEVKARLDDIIQHIIIVLSPETEEVKTISNQYRYESYPHKNYKDIKIYPIFTYLPQCPYLNKFDYNSSGSLEANIVTWRYQYVQDKDGNSGMILDFSIDMVKEGTTFAIYGQTPDSDCHIINKGIVDGNYVKTEDCTDAAEVNEDAYTLGSQNNELNQYISTTSDNIILNAYYCTNIKGPQVLYAVFKNNNSYLVVPIFLCSAINKYYSKYTNYIASSSQIFADNEITKLAGYDFLDSIEYIANIEDPELDGSVVSSLTIKCTPQYTNSYPYLTLSKNYKITDLESTISSDFTLESPDEQHLKNQFYFTLDNSQFKYSTVSIGNAVYQLTSGIYQTDNAATMGQLYTNTYECFTHYVVATCQPLDFGDYVDDEFKEITSYTIWKDSKGNEDFHIGLVNSDLTTTTVNDYTYMIISLFYNSKQYNFALPSNLYYWTKTIGSNSKLYVSDIKILNWPEGDKFQITLKSRKQEGKATASEESGYKDLIEEEGKSYSSILEGFTQDIVVDIPQDEITLSKEISILKPQFDSNVSMDTSSIKYHDIDGVTEITGVNSPDEIYFRELKKSIPGIGYNNGVVLNDATNYSYLDSNFIVRDVISSSYSLDDLQDITPNDQYSLEAFKVYPKYQILDSSSYQGNPLGVCCKFTFNLAYFDYSDTAKYVTKGCIYQVQCNTEGELIFKPFNSETLSISVYYSNDMDTVEFTRFINVSYTDLQGLTIQKAISKYISSDYIFDTDTNDSYPDCNISEGGCTFNDSNWKFSKELNSEYYLTNQYKFNPYPFRDFINNPQPFSNSRYYFSNNALDSFMTNHKISITDNNKNDILTKIGTTTQENCFLQWNGYKPLQVQLIKDNLDKKLCPWKKNVYAVSPTTSFDKCPRLYNLNVIQ